MPKDLVGDGDLNTKKNFRNGFVKASTENEFRTWWSRILKEYWGSQLTFESDGLVAPLGVITVIEKHRKGRYHAGLWEETLVNDLLWNVLDPRPRENIPLTESLTKKITCCGYPTWSWVSMYGKKVIMPSRSYRVPRITAKVIGNSSTTTFPCYTEPLKLRSTLQQSLCRLRFSAIISYMCSNVSLLEDGIPLSSSTCKIDFCWRTEEDGNRDVWAIIVQDWKET